MPEAPAAKDEKYEDSEDAPPKIPRREDSVEEKFSSSESSGISDGEDMPVSHPSQLKKNKKIVAKEDSQDEQTLEF